MYEPSAFEILEVAARRGAALTEIFRTARSFAVRLVGGRRHLHEAHLPDLHTGVQGDGQAGHVGQFESDVAVETRVDESGCGVDEESESPERTLALDTCHQIIGNGDSFEGGAKDELTRVQHEHTVERDLHQFGEVGHVLLHIDHASGVIAKHPEQIRHPDVDRRGLDHGLVERIDDDPTGGQGFSDAAVGQDHDPTVVGRPAYLAGDGPVGHR